MIKLLNVHKYKKIENITFVFSKNINVISGNNGTCKTSLLHVISNSFQRITKKCEWIYDFTCIDVINKVNTIFNPKIESLSRGDKKLNDPGNGFKGNLITVEYFNTQSLGFRKHNSPKNQRYSLKPFYKEAKKETLPFSPIIYLGLFRLHPYGEYSDDSSVEKIKRSLPEIYLSILNTLYESFTRLAIHSIVPQKMGNLKIRSEFETNLDGIDSNTISAGEDNLYIILHALVSLRYYFESISSTREVESILLIDEVDATLHPHYQIKLLKLFKEYSEKFKIQMFFTTHSLSLIEEAFKENHNVTYLIDNFTSVIKMESPDIYKIKYNLKCLTKDEYYSDKIIPIFSEDDEARFFMNCLFDCFEKQDSNFQKIRKIFHIVKSKIGADNLLSIFKDDFLKRTTHQIICILDGDQHMKKNLTKNIIVLPGEKSPENLIIEHAKYLLSSSDPIWKSDDFHSSGLSKNNFHDTVMREIANIEQEIQNNQSLDASETRRKEKKRIFNKHLQYFKPFLIHWIESPLNQKSVSKFKSDLNIMFQKLAPIIEINPNDWRINQ